MSNDIEEITKLLKVNREAVNNFQSDLYAIKRLIANYDTLKVELKKQLKDLYDSIEATKKTLVELDKRNKILGDQIIELTLLQDKFMPIETIGNNDYISINHIRPPYIFSKNIIVESDEELDSSVDEASLVRSTSRFN